MGATQWWFYVDGETSPRLSLTHEELFGGQFPTVPPLSDTVSGGFYSYLPIPFSRSLRVMASVTPFTPSSRKYYHLNYSQYPAGTEVASFATDLTDPERLAVTAVTNNWGDMAGQLRGTVRSQGEPIERTVRPGETFVWLERTGSGLLESFSIDLQFDETTTQAVRSAMLRQLALRIFWDDRKTPSVNVPLGDFFCNAFYRREFAALPLGLVDGTYVCRFPMPFERAVRAEIVNDGRTPVKITCRHKLSETTRLQPVRYFHAGWSQSSENGRPLGILSTKGKGHFVGVYLNAIGMDGNWFILEGDEVIRVDGETKPSWHGTGLEDFFNGAWYYFGIFDLPLHGLVEKAPIRTGQYRFLVNDAIPFEKRIDVSIEFGAHNRSRGYMSSVAYWYQEKPATGGSGVPPPEQRFPPPDPLEPHALMGQVFELERIGHLAEARERCLIYAEKFGDQLASRLVELRAAAYLEALEGLEAAKPVYDRIAATDEQAVATQAKALLWFHTNPQNAFVTSHANARYVLYLDGTKIAEGENPAFLAIAPRVLTPGEHVLTAEVTPIRGDAWLSVCVRTHKGDYHSDGAWEYCKTKPAGWPLAEGGEWEAVKQPGLDEMLPRMNTWQFAPNAFIGTQSKKQLLRAWYGWDRQSGQNTVYFRSKVTVPADSVSGKGKDPDSQNS